MSNYAKRQALDEGSNVITQVPSPFPALRAYNKDNGVASSVISLHPNTTRVEVGAFGGQGAVVKWIPTTDTTQASVISSGLSNFDHYVPAGTFRQFVVPRETAGNPLVVGGQIGSVQGLYQRIAVINAGATASSILANEF